MSEDQKTLNAVTIDAAVKALTAHANATRLSKEATALSNLFEANEPCLSGDVDCDECTQRTECDHADKKYQDKANEMHDKYKEAESLTETALALLKAEGVLA